jgi:Fe-S oxidoreductase
MTLLRFGLVGAALVLALTAACYLRRWSTGASVSVDWAAGLARLPRAYLRDVHAVVARERCAAAMHALTAGGFLGSLLLLAAIAIDLWRGPFAGACLLLALAVMVVGTALVIRRRWPHRPRRLSAGGFQWLPLLLLAFVLGAGVVGLREWGAFSALDRASRFGEVLTVVAVVLLVVQVSAGPLKHAFAGAVHLIVHPRPARFATSRPVADLALADVSAMKLGVGAIGEFAWNRLVSFDACVECGRCEAACPANAAGLPLNPKAFIQELVAAMPGPTGGRYIGSPHPPRVDLDSGTYMKLGGNGLGLHTDTLWACTTCRACVYECPMMIEHVDAIVDLRRYQTLERGATPGKGAAVLAELAATDTVSGRSLDSRLDWAADLRLSVLADRGAADVLLWLGEGAYEFRNQQTLRALVRLLRHAQIDFAVLGAEELDSGDLARRLGHEAQFQDLARRNIATLAKYRFERILTADPHVLHCLKNEYPALGGHYEVVHHSKFLADLLAAGRIKPARALQGSITYHDPCYLARYNGEIDAPRALVDRLGVERREMERAGMRSFCCGGGGGAPLTDIPGKQRIPDLRMAQARATGATTLAVACPNCRLMFEGVVGPRPAVADIAELLEATL